MERPKNKRVKNEKYLRKVRLLLCVVCGVSPCDANHKLGGGMATKTNDTETFPLCREHHAQFHADPIKWQAEHGSEDFHIQNTKRIIKQQEARKLWFES